MKTLEEVLEIMEARIDRPTLEQYIARDWLRPVPDRAGWRFEEIDIARLRLVCHLLQDIRVNEDGIDVALSLLDQLYGARAQLYGTRAHMQKLTDAVARQPPQVRTEIMMVVKQMTETKENP
jgi:chaperone modulatory protein CbpM